MERAKEKGERVIEQEESKQETREEERTTTPITPKHQAERATTRDAREIT